MFKGNMPVSPPSDLYDGLSDTSTEDSFLVYKNMQRIPNVAMPKFKKPPGKLFQKVSPSVPRVRKSGLLKLLKIDRKSLICSTPMNLSFPDSTPVNHNSVLQLSPIVGGSSSILAGNLENKKPKQRLNGTLTNKNKSANKSHFRKSLSFDARSIRKRKSINTSVRSIVQHLKNVKNKSVDKKPKKIQNIAVQENVITTNTQTDTEECGTTNNNSAPSIKEPNQSISKTLTSDQNVSSKDDHCDLDGIDPLDPADKANSSFKSIKNNRFTMRKTALMERETQTTDSLSKVLPKRSAHSGKENKDITLESEHHNNSLNSSKRKILQDDGPPRKKPKETLGKAIEVDKPSEAATPKLNSQQSKTKEQGQKFSPNNSKILRSSNKKLELNKQLEMEKRNTKVEKYQSPRRKLMYVNSETNTNEVCDEQHVNGKNVNHRKSPNQKQHKAEKIVEEIEKQKQIEFSQNNSMSPNRNAGQTKKDNQIKIPKSPNKVNKSLNTSINNSYSNSMTLRSTSHDNAILDDFLEKFDTVVNSIMPSIISISSASENVSRDVTDVSEAQSLNNEVENEVEMVIDTRTGRNSRNINKHQTLDSCEEETELNVSVGKNLKPIRAAIQKENQKVVEVNKKQANPTVKTQSRNMSKSKTVEEVQVHVASKHSGETERAKVVKNKELENRIDQSYKSGNETTNAVVNKGKSNASKEDGNRKKPVEISKKNITPNANNSNQGDSSITLREKTNSLVNTKSRNAGKSRKLEDTIDDTEIVSKTKKSNKKVAKESSQLHNTIEDATTVPLKRGQQSVTEKRHDEEQIPHEATKKGKPRGSKFKGSPKRATLLTETSSTATSISTTTRGRSGGSRSTRLSKAAPVQKRRKSQALKVVFCNYEPYFVNRLSGFVRIENRNSDVDTPDNSREGESRPKRQRRPPSSYIQSTLIGSAMTRKILSEPKTIKPPTRKSSRSRKTRGMSTESATEVHQETPKSPFKKPLPLNKKSNKKGKASASATKNEEHKTTDIENEAAGDSGAFTMSKDISEVTNLSTLPGCSHWTNNVSTNITNQKQSQTKVPSESTYSAEPTYDTINDNVSTNTTTNQKRSQAKKSSKMVHSREPSFNNENNNMSSTTTTDGKVNISAITTTNRKVHRTRSVSRAELSCETSCNDTSVTNQKHFQSRKQSKAEHSQELSSNNQNVTSNTTSNQRKTRTKKTSKVEYSIEPNCSAENNSLPTDIVTNEEHLQDNALSEAVHSVELNENEPQETLMGSSHFSPKAVCVQQTYATVNVNQYEQPPSGNSDIIIHKNITIQPAVHPNGSLKTAYSSTRLSSEPGCSQQNTINNSNNQEHLQSGSNSHSRIVICNDISLQTSTVNSTAVSKVNTPRKSVTFISPLVQNREDIQVCNRSLFPIQEEKTFGENDLEHNDDNLTQVALPTANPIEEHSPRVLYTLINKEVVASDWESQLPQFDSNESHSICVNYGLTHAKSEFGTMSSGLIRYGPQHKTIQVTKKHSIMYKVEKGRATVGIQLQHVTVGAGHCFHIPLGSYYTIENLSQAEPLILYFVKITS